MNKNTKIWELSDSEFLNFLYTERDREYSKHSEWGVNFWVVGAAIIGLLGYAYHAIAKDYNLFDWRLFVFYSTVLGALIICGMLLLSPVIQGRRWVNKNRVTTIGRSVFNDTCFFCGDLFNRVSKECGMIKGNAGDNREQGRLNDIC